MKIAPHPFHWFSVPVLYPTTVFHFFHSMHILDQFCWHLPAQYQSNIRHNLYHFPKKEILIEDFKIFLTFFKNTAFINKNEPLTQQILVAPIILLWTVAVWGNQPHCTFLCTTIHVLQSWLERTESRLLLQRKATTKNSPSNF